VSDVPEDFSIATRELLADFPLQYLSRKSKGAINCEIIVTNDMVLLAKLSKKGTMKVKDTCAVQNTSVVAVIDGEIGCK
jgi:hypothetical protein